MQCATLFVICVLVLNCVLAAEECAKSKESKHSLLKESLLCGYDKEIRPILNQKNATTVNVKMILKYVKYEMHSGTMDVGSWLALVWKDEHLTWSPDDHDGIKSIHMASDNIWIPDISIYNGASTGSSQSIFNSVNCILYKDGTVICISPVSSDASCDADLSKYPFDVQNCSLRYGSWVHSGEEIDFQLTVPAISTEDYTDSGEWKLLSVNVTKTSGHFNCCPDSTYPSLNYEFQVARQSGSHVAMIIIPSLVLIMITLMTWCMNPGENERVTVIMGNMVIHILFVQFIYWQLPVSGPHPPLIIIFARDSLLLAAFTLFLTLLQRKLLMIKTNSPIWISRIVAGVVNSRPGQLIFVFDDNFKQIANINGDEDGANIIENVENQKNKDWLIFAKILDRICFFTYLIVYFCMFIAFVP